MDMTTATQVQATEQVNYVSLALTPEEQVKYAELKVKVANDIPTTNQEDALFQQLKHKVAQKRAEAEKAPKLEAFVNNSKELVAMGFKMADLIAAIKGTPAESKQEIVVAVFPEITIPDASGNMVPFQYKANKKYAGRGVDAEAIKKIKAKGHDYFVQHLNEDGKKWYEEKVQMKRKDKAGNIQFKFPAQEYVAKMFGGAATPAAKKTTPKK